MNYDLIAAENKTLSKEKKKELFEYIVELIEENIFIDNLNKGSLQKNKVWNFSIASTWSTPEPGDGTKKKSL